METVCHTFYYSTQSLVEHLSGVGPILHCDDHDNWPAKVVQQGHYYGERRTDDEHG